MAGCAAATGACGLQGSTSPNALQNNSRRAPSPRAPRTHQAAQARRAHVSGFCSAVRRLPPCNHSMAISSSGPCTEQHQDGQGNGAPRRDAGAKAGRPGQGRRSRGTQGGAAAPLLNAQLMVSKAGRPGKRAHPDGDAQQRHDVWVRAAAQQSSLLPGRARVDAREELVHLGGGKGVRSFYQTLTHSLNTSQSSFTRKGHGGSTLGSAGRWSAIWRRRPS